MEAILVEINKLPDTLKPIKNQGLKYLLNDPKIVDGTINILHRPWIAPLNWSIRLFNEVNTNWYSRFSESTNKIIPNFYKEFLKISNGASVHDLTLFGLTPSIYQNGILDRSIIQCLDLTTANNYWQKEYKVDQNSFHFGSRVYSDEENIGYFASGENEISAIRKNGQKINQWIDFSTFLDDEIKEAETMMLKEIPKSIKSKIKTVANNGEHS